MKGQIIKKVANNFLVKIGDKNISCIPRGNLKSSGIFVGDYVEIENDIIENIHPRKNQFIRPPLANLDALVIVIANVPKPDFMIVDKMILFSLCYGVEPILVINKIDSGKELYDYVKKVYRDVVKNIFATNAILGEGIEQLKKALNNKLCAFSGQSAVGKSALVNSILKEHASTVGEISIKNQKGKNTTRHCEIFFEKNISITDTAGFTSLDEKLLPIAYYELPYYYPDFVKIMKDCKYKSCVHINEKDSECAIKQALNNLIDKDRYLRYKQIYNILLQKWVRTHG